MPSDNPSPSLPVGAALRRGGCWVDAPMLAVFMVAVVPCLVV